MFDHSEDEIEILKQQLELIKKKDRVLEEIEIRLHQMKTIAQQAANNDLPMKEREQLNEQIQEHQTVIKTLENYMNSGF
ncbi:hypothetical protein ACFSFY_02175 [Sporosarcina siberiensis]|uniref:YgaB-like protein n=1 Tax=Sporosarcina siberiensis TaxID=1365606 RepID=A0ABW4SBM4_9BACL